MGGEIKKRKNRMKKEEITWLFFFLFVCLTYGFRFVCIFALAGSRMTVMECRV